MRILGRNLGGGSDVLVPEVLSKPVPVPTFVPPSTPLPSNLQTLTVQPPHVPRPLNPYTGGTRTARRALLPYEQHTLSIIMGIQNFINSKIVQATPAVKREYLGGGMRDSMHPAISLWNRPNEDYRGRKLLQMVAVTALFEEAAYIWKRRDNTGRVRALTFWPTRYVHQRREVESERLIDSFRVETNRGTRYVPREDMIVVNFGGNILDPSRGLNALESIGEDTFAFRAIIRVATAISSGMGTASGMLTPPERLELEDLEESREALKEIQPDGDRPGEVYLLDDAYKIQQLGFEPSKMALEPQMVHAESHICEALRIHPAVLYSIAGLKYDNTRSGRQESRKESYTEVIIPLWETIAEALTYDLLPEYADQGIIQRGDFRWVFDYSAVEELNIDQNERWARFGQALQMGAISLNEWRAGAGFAAVEGPNADRITLAEEQVTDRQSPAEEEERDDDEA